MRLFNLIKDILLQIHGQDKLVDFAIVKKKNKLLVFNQVSQKGTEQEVLDRIFEGKDWGEKFEGYISWMTGEIMNNVFDHGQTLGKTLRGGILALDIQNNILQLAIGDLGIGIKASLEKHPQIQEQKIDNQKAIKLALSEDISGWPYKRGNGLPDVLRIMKAGKGSMQIYSDNIIFNNGKFEKTNLSFPGVIVAVELKIHDFEVPRRGAPKGKVFKLGQLGAKLSGREKGQETYELLVQELAQIPKSGALLIDLSDIKMMNSSFGDQSLGVLLENIDKGHFGAKKIYFTGKINEVVRLCLDRISEIRKIKIDIV